MKYYEEMEYYEEGSEAPNNFRAILHGRFDVVVKCELQFNSNCAWVTALQTPYEANAFELTTGKYVLDKFVRDKATWSDRENKPKPFVLKKVYQISK